MTKINDPNNLSNGDLFGYEIKYNNPVYSSVATGKFNGNIAEIDWRNLSDDILKRYNYTYDGLNRLQQGLYAEPGAGNPHNGNFDEYLSYDLNGNITNLQRKAIPVSGLTSTLVDNLDYQYTGNRLNQIIENAMNDTGYEGGNNLIGYDANGNMVDMLDKGIQNVQYNHINLPKNFQFVPTSVFGVPNYINLSYLYRADGTKLRKIYSVRGEGRNQPTNNTITDYLDGFHYNYNENVSCITCRTEFAFEEMAYQKKDIILDPGGGLDPPVWRLDFVPTTEGFYSFTENRYIYNYSDHLGNTRVSYAKKTDGSLEITDRNDYYPFGLNHIGGLKGKLGGYTSYKYNGKEVQETGMYDYGWRMYMPDIGRWGVMDPLSEKGHNFSPYNYTINNPIRFIDPDGLWISITDGDNQYRYSNGQTQHKVNGKWQAIDKSVTLSDNVRGIISGLQSIGSGGDTGAGIISYYDNKDHDINIQSTAGENYYENGTAYVNLSLKSNYPTSDGQVSDSPFYIKLGHEMGHGMDPMKKSDLFGPWVGGKTKNDNVSHSEIFASHIENKLRAENGLPLRVSYMVNPNNKIANGVDLKTMLIDSSGNSVYFNGYGQNLQNQLKPGDPYNAFMDYIGCGQPLKGRYNYYENVKKQKK